MTRHVHGCKTCQQPGFSMSKSSNCLARCSIAAVSSIASASDRGPCSAGLLLVCLPFQGQHVASRNHPHRSSALNSSVSARDVGGPQLIFWLAALSTSSCNCCVTSVAVRCASLLVGRHDGPSPPTANLHVVGGCGASPVETQHGEVRACLTLLFGAHHGGAGGLSPPQRLRLLRTIPLIITHLSLLPAFPLLFATSSRSVIAARLQRASHDEHYSYSALWAFA